MPHSPLLPQLVLVAAGLISLMSLLVPMALGVAAAATLYGQCAPDGVALPTFALFMPSAMSITAFPIMARILKERGMTHSLIGRLSLTAAALAAAVAGKVLGGAAGARIAGYPRRTAFAVGSFMNARALMELIVMKVGLDAGVIGRDPFTMLIVIAILTTFMTGPLLTLFAWKGDAQVAEARETVARP